MYWAIVQLEICFEYPVVDVSFTITDSRSGRRIEPINKIQMVSPLTWLGLVVSWKEQGREESVIVGKSEN